MINVLITGVSGNNTGTQILKALMMLPDKYKVIVTDINRHSYGFLMVNDYHVVPKADSPDYIPTMLDICEKDEVKALVPGSEPELKILSQNRHVFEEKGIMLLTNNQRAIEIGMNKEKTVSLLKENGFAYPKSMTLDPTLEPKAQAQKVLQKLEFPLVIKPYLGSGGSSNLFIAQTKEELIFYCDYLAKRPGLSMIVQEYVGSPDEEYTIGVMSDQSGKAFSCFILKRLINSTMFIKLQEPNHVKNRIKTDFLTISTGISQGFAIESNEIKEFAFSLANTLGSTGPLNLQCRRTDQGMVLFEINPRFSGTTSIRALCGHNDPDMIIRTRLGTMEPKQVEYKKGLILRSLENNLLEGLSPSNNS